MHIGCPTQSELSSVHIHSKYNFCFVVFFQLRILHKARARRSSNSGCGRPNTTNHKPPVCGTNTVSSTERRSVYLRRLQEIWPSDGSTSDSCELTQPVLTTADPPGVSPCVYTSPMECPLSLLSFVSESLSNIHSQSTTIKASNPVKDAESTRTEASQMSSEQRASERPNLLVSPTSELTVQVHSADQEQRSPTVSYFAHLTLVIICFDPICGLDRMA